MNARLQRLQRYNQPQPALPPAEKFLHDNHIVYEKADDGTITVPGDIHLGLRGLEELPDLTDVVVKGSFVCNNNDLTSLAGCPAFVGKDFMCQDNKLITLEGGPKYVGGDYWCGHNRLTSLKGAAPIVEGDFNCRNNNLTTLEQGPVSVGGMYKCMKNPLEHFYGRPRKYSMIQSDLGVFVRDEDIPSALQLSPMMKEIIAHESVIVTRPTPVLKKLTLKKKDGP